MKLANTMWLLFAFSALGQSQEQASWQQEPTAFISVPFGATLTDAKPFLENVETAVNKVLGITDSPGEISVLHCYTACCNLYYPLDPNFPSALVFFEFDENRFASAYFS